MSFPKAKLHRYYDNVSCAPPPGKYDPKFGSKVKGAILDKSERFGTPKMEHTSSIESLDSIGSFSNTPAFRTPSKAAIIKKGPLSTPRLNARSRIPLPDKFTPSQIMDNEQKLIDQINELTRVHQLQLVEKNEEIATLIDQVNSLNENISNLMTKQTGNVNKSDYENEINKLSKELLDLQVTLTSCKQDYTSQVNDLKTQISALEENITNHMSINKELEDSLVEKSIIYEEINTNISEMSEGFTLQLNTFMETVNKVEDINKCLMEDYKKTVELLSTESSENFENKRLLIELQESMDLCRDDLARALKRCKMYEVVQTETSKTINVLSKRLMESEVEVDHLNDLQQDLILKKNELEILTDALTKDNDQLKASMISLEQSIRLEVEANRNILLEQVESFKEMAKQALELQRQGIVEKEDHINELLAQIEIYKSNKLECDSQLACCQAKVSDYEKEISELQSTAATLENYFQEKIQTKKIIIAQMSEEYETLKDLALKEKDQFEEKIMYLSQKKSSLEKYSMDKDMEISSLKQDIDKLNHQALQNQNRIKHLECVTMTYDEKIDSMTSKIDNYNATINEKNEIIDNYQKRFDEIESSNNLIKSSLTEREEELKTTQAKYEAQSQALIDLKRKLMDMQDSNQYLDGVISELVLEKERVTELTNTNDSLRKENQGFISEINYLKNVLEESMKDVKEEAGNIKCQKREDLLSLEKTVKEQLEVIQLLEYERIALSLDFEECLHQKDDLIDRKKREIEVLNRELEVLSETADRHFAIKRDLELEINQLNEEKEQLKDTRKEDSMKVTSLEARIADLECRNQELMDIIGPFKNQLIQYDQERSALLSITENTEKELRALELEHAKSLGHQNHKQKIKHIVNLNQTIATLKKDVEKYRTENNKLRNELRNRKPSSLLKNKENKTSTESIGRTTSPSKALKDRNG